MGTRRPYAARRPEAVLPAVLSSGLALCLSGVLAGCSGDTGPSPTPAADALAAGLSAGDLSKVTFVDAAAGAVQRQYAATVAGLGGVTPKVAVDSVTTHGDTDATATLTWSWPLGSGWRYTTSAPLKASGSTWEVAWSSDVVQSSLKNGERLDATPIHARRGDILGARGVGLVTDRPVVKFGVDRLKVPASQAAASARRLAQLVGIDVASYVRQVATAGPKAFVQAIAFRKEEVPPAVLTHYHQIKGVDAIAADIPLAITKDFAAPILGTVGPVTAEIIKDNPGSTPSATTPACPASRRGTTNSSGGRRGSSSPRSTPRVATAGCSRARRSTARRCG